MANELIETKHTQVDTHAIVQAELVEQMDFTMFQIDSYEFWIDLL